MAKRDPEAGVETTDEEQLSVVETEKLTTAPQEPGSLFTEILEGQTIAGSS